MGVLLPVILALLVQGAQQVSADADQQSRRSEAAQQSAVQQPSSATQPAPDDGQAPAGNQQTQPAGKPPAGTTASPTSSDHGSYDDIWSIEHIKKELERKPTLTFKMPDPNVPRYQIEIQGQRTLTLPSWQQSFQLPTPPGPQPFGGQDYWNMMRVNTPPQFWGSAPFTNTDLLKMYGLTGAYGLAGALIKKAIEARQSAAAARAHEEVQQELADLEEHNARIAAGQGEDGDGKTADKKKQRDAEKKKKKKK